MRRAEHGWLLTTGEKGDWARKAGIPVLGGTYAEAASGYEGHFDQLFALPPAPYLYDSHPELYAIRDKSVDAVPLPLYEAWVKFLGAHAAYQIRPNVTLSGDTFTVTDVGLAIISPVKERSLVLKKAKTQADREVVAEALMRSIGTGAHLRYLTAMVTGIFGADISNQRIELRYADLGMLEDPYIVPIIDGLIMQNGHLNAHRTGSLDVLDAYGLTRREVQYTTRQVRPSGFARVNGFVLPRGIVDVGVQHYSELLGSQHIESNKVNLAYAARGLLGINPFTISGSYRND